MWETHDPGVVKRDSITTTVKRGNLREGKQIHYDRPGTSLHAVTLVSLDEKGVLLSVAGREVRLVAGEYVELDHSGESYGCATMVSRQVANGPS